MARDLLLYALEAARQHRVRIDYLETNAGWCDDEATARLGFTELRQAGLDAVLISASLFHNEFIPLAKTKAAITTAMKIFGRGGVIVWTPDTLSLMDQGLDDDRRHTLRESCDLLGIDRQSGDLWRVHNYLTPGGRWRRSVVGRQLPRRAMPVGPRPNWPFPYRPRGQPDHRLLPRSVGRHHRRFPPRGDRRGGPALPPTARRGTLWSLAEVGPGFRAERQGLYQ